MSTHSRRPRGAMLVAAAVFLAGCLGPGPTPTPTPSPSPTATPSVSPTPTPSPTATKPPTFPLAVVTGITNLKSVIALSELTKLAGSSKLAMPCGVTVSRPALSSPKPCVPPNRIAAAIAGDQQLVALLPPGLVEPATKVLGIAGKGPFGLFGPDLFGDKASRALPYPVMGVASGGTATLKPAWIAYHASQVWTLTSVGSMCADRLGAYQAVTLGKGWDWVFDGGTARYTGGPFLNPNPPPGISQFPIIQAVDTGHPGVTASITKRSDIALGDHKCPILPTQNWAPSLTGPPSLAVPEELLPRWKNLLGIDAVFLAADHQSETAPKSGIATTAASATSRARSSSLRSRAARLSQRKPAASARNR